MIKVEGKNIGNGTAAPSHVAVEFRTGYCDPYIPMGTGDVGQLNPGQGTIIPGYAYNCNAIPKPSEHFFVKAKADSAHIVDEEGLGEADNTRTIVISSRRCCIPCELECTETLPSSFSWKNTNWLTGVKDQGCGSCWAYSAAGTVETKRNIELGAKNDINLME